MISCLSDVDQDGAEENLNMLIDVAEKQLDLVRGAVPNLKQFKVLPVDPVHPKFMTMMCTTDVMEQACNSSAAVPPDCDEFGQPWRTFPRPSGTGHPLCGG